MKTSKSCPESFNQFNFWRDPLPAIDGIESKRAKEDAIKTLMKLDQYFRGRSYVLGYELSSADFTLRDAIEALSDDVKGCDEEHCPHYSRWVRHVSSYVDLRSRREREEGGAGGDLLRGVLAVGEVLE